VSGTGGLDDAAADEVGEVGELRRRLAELEEALRALADGEADSLVVGAPGAERVVSVSGTDLPYRVMVERLGDGAATVARDGTVLVANQPFARLLGVDAASLRGWPLTAFVVADHMPSVLDLLAVEVGDTRRSEVTLRIGQHTNQVLLSTTAVRAAQETIVCCAVADVTEHRRLVAQLEQERARAQQRDDRMRTALEVNDTIVQGLVTAEMTLDLGQQARARQILAATSVRARELIGELTGDVRAGMLRRGTPAQIEEDIP
jgi:PAS domain S-box-containing protein